MFKQFFSKLQISSGLYFSEKRLSVITCYRENNIIQIADYYSLLLDNKQDYEYALHQFRQRLKKEKHSFVLGLPYHQTIMRTTSVSKELNDNQIMQFLLFHGADFFSNQKEKLYVDFEEIGDANETGKKFIRIVSNKNNLCEQLTNLCKKNGLPLKIMAVDALVLPRAMKFCRNYEARKTLALVSDIDGQILFLVFNQKTFYCYTGREGLIDTVRKARLFYENTHQHTICHYYYVTTSRDYQLELTQIRQSFSIPITLIELDSCKVATQQIHAINKSKIIPAHLFTAFALALEGFNHGN